MVLSDILNYLVTLVQLKGKTTPEDGLHLVPLLVNAGLLETSSPSQVSSVASVLPRKPGKASARADKKEKGWRTVGSRVRL